MAYDLSNVAVIIPNWNGSVLLKRHLASVCSVLKSAEIIVVDDASEDDSVSYVRNTFPEVKIIEKKTHDGFSSTVNAGAAQTKREFLLLLNTDIDINNISLHTALSYFSNPSVFAVGLLDKSIEETGFVQRGRGVAVFLRGMYVHSKGNPVKQSTAWVSGGSGIFRKSMWDALGGMDTIFDPFYWEDIDLSYRAVKAGFSILFSPETQVIHKHDEGAIKITINKKNIERTAFRNQLLFHWKNLDFSYLVQHVCYLPYHMFRICLKRKFTMALGLADALVYIPVIYRKRKKIQRIRTDKEIFTLLPQV